VVVAEVQLEAELLLEVLVQLAELVELVILDIIGMMKPEVKEHMAAVVVAEVEVLAHKANLQ
jgi:hypothetical protein